MQIDLQKCTGCGFCMRDCPLEAVRVVEKTACIDPALCTQCGVCLRVCPEAAVSADDNLLPGVLICDACPISCRIPDGATGACQRYVNQDGRVVRTTGLLPFGAVATEAGPLHPTAIRTPLITGIGAGTTYPDCKPAPGIVQARRQGVDVVTVVTEVPLSYSSVLLKIDTDVPIGREGEIVCVGKRPVGMVETEQYGSKMLHIGGVNRLTGPDGFVVARTITDIANRRPVKLKIENGSRLQVQVGHAPVIDGRPAAKMRVGCGSATLGIFAPLLKSAADEAIVLDAHITGQMSRHAAGRYAGVRPSGVELVFAESTPGRCFGDHGPGWGGTSIVDPRQAICRVDMNIARKGMTVLVTETTGQNGALFTVGADGELVSQPLSEEARNALAAISDSCEPSRVSAIYMGGAGGSARAGVTRYPIKLTRAVHAGKARLSVGGAAGFVLPGGGISFMVDVERVRAGSFYWTPTPATICPLEYTMTLADYDCMGGHVAAMRPLPADPPVSPKSDED